MFFGNPATTSNVTLLQTTTSTVLALNTTTGVVTITPNTLAGFCTLGYSICNAVNNIQCDAGIVSVRINNPALTASNYNFTTVPINTCTGGTTPAVLSNDGYCTGALGSTPVITTLVSGSIDGATLGNTGIISIPAGTPLGSYTFTYTFCLINSPTSCSTVGSVIVKVIGNLQAVNDDFSLNGINTLYGGLTPSLIINDTSGSIPVVSNEVSIIINSTNPPSAITNFSITNSGEVWVLAGTPIGTYVINYCISSITCPTNKSCASSTIVVTDLVSIPTAVQGIRADNIVSLVDTQIDNKIVIAGYFQNYNNIGKNNITRIKDNLTLDTQYFNSIGAVPEPAIPLLYLAKDMKVIKNIRPNLNKILLVGPFRGYSGSSIQGAGIARLLANGDIDPTFNTGPIPTGATRGFTGANNEGRTIYIYPDNALNGNAGKMLIGGMFTTYNGVASNKLVRLNTDGSLDLAFSNNINTLISSTQGTLTRGFISTPQGIDVQSNGKIIVTGYFTFFNGVRKSRILRLLSNGTLDASFTGYLGTSVDAVVNPNETAGFIEKIIVDENDNIIVAGYFSKCNNISRNSIARFLPDGGLDLNFNPGTGFFPTHTAGIPYDADGVGLIRSIVYEKAIGTQSGKLYVSGGFTKFNNLQAPKIIRLNCATTSSTGLRDDTFKVDPQGSLNIGGPNGDVWCMKKQGEKLILAGEFTMYNLNNSLRITRIFPVSPGSSNEAKSTNSSYFDSEPEIDLYADTSNYLIIYPNPNSGLFSINIENNKEEESLVSIYSLMGQKVFEKNVLISNNFQLDATTLQKGSYYMVLKNANGNRTKTFIIN